MINKKIIIMIALILLISVALLGCVEKQQQLLNENVVQPIDEDVVQPIDENNMYKKNISFETIILNSFSGYEKSKNYIIKEEQDWNLLRNKLQLPLPDIDFTKYMVIAAFQGLQNTGGYSIEINEIVESDEKITIYITKTSPHPDAFVIMVLTDPVHIVKLESIDKEIVFNVTDIISDIGGGENT